MKMTNLFTVLALLLLLVGLSLPSSASESSDSLVETAIHQTRCPRRCRTDRSLQRRICRRRGCRLNRCSDFANRLAYNCRPRLMPLITPVPIPPVIIVGASVPDGDRIVSCSIDTQLAVGLQTTVNGVNGVIIFRTYPPEAAADQIREAACLADGTSGLPISQLLLIAGGVCVPQPCAVTATSCACPISTTFCFREEINQAVLGNCPATA